MSYTSALRKAACGWYGIVILIAIYLVTFNQAVNLK